jgi:hypothetical protein
LSEKLRTLGDRRERDGIGQLPHLRESQRTKDDVRAIRAGEAGSLAKILAKKNIERERCRACRQPSSTR